MATFLQTQTQTRHAHHHHHHHHHHDNTYLISANKNDAGVRITRIGLYSNLGMAIAKGVGGYVFNSQAMVADAWHSLTDLASDILTLATVSWSLKPPTEEFPTGFGKIESLGSLGVSGMLLTGGILMGLNSCETLYAHFMLDAHSAAEMAVHAHGHSHSHAHGAGVPSLHAAWLALGTIVIKEWLYHATMKVANARKSSVLASNAVHHRVDSLTGIVTLAAIIGANVLEHAAWLDPVGGLLISIMVIRAGFSNTFSSLFELVDKTIDDEVKESVSKTAYKALAKLPYADEIEIREVHGLKSGQNYLLDVEVAAPPAWTLARLSEIEETAREAIGTKVRGARRVKFRFVSKEEPAAKLFDEFISGEVSQRASPEPEDDHDHNHDHDHSEPNHDAKKNK